MSFLAEDILDEFLDPRNARHAADEDDLIDLVRQKPGILQSILHRTHAALDQILHQLFKLGARQVHVQMFRTVSRCRDKRQVDLRLHELRKFHLGLLSRLPESLEGHWVFPKIDTLLFLELIGNVVENAHVEVVAAEMCIAVRRLHLEDPFAELEDGNIEGSATEVKHGDFGVLPFLIEPVGKRCRCRFIDNTTNIQSRNLARFLRSLPLCVIEVCRDRDDGIRDLRSKIILRGLLHFLKDHGGDLRRGIHPVANLDPCRIVFAMSHFVGDEFHFLVDLVEETAHKSLDRIDGILRIGHSLPFCRRADEPLS